MCVWEGKKVTIDVKMKAVCYGIGGCVGFLHSLDKKKQEIERRERKKKGYLGEIFLIIIHLPIRICICNY